MRPEIGDHALRVLLVGSVATGVFAPGEGRGSLEAACAQAEAFSLAYGLSSLLKTVFRRSRPGSSESNDSFPSGHAAAAFAAATLIERNSGPELGLPAYGLATLTAYSRVEAGRHFPSDVLAGAAIGTLAAGVVDALHFGTGRKGTGISRSRIEPHVGVDASGRMLVGVSIRF